MKGIVKLGHYSVDFYLSEISRQSNTNYTLIDCNFNEINRNLPENYQNLEPILSGLTASTYDQGIRKLLLPNITLHNIFYLFPKWLNGIELCDPFEHITIPSSKKKVYVLGSRHIHTSLVFNERINNINLSPQVLNDETIKTIDTIRLNAYQNGYSSTDALTLSNIIQMLSQTHPVIIACSELSLSLANHTPFSSQVTDLANIQIAHFIK